MNLNKNIGNKKIEIIPAIMPQSFDEIGEKAILVKKLVKTVQLDLMDGEYVSEKTWPLYKSKRFLDSGGEDLELPFWEDVNYELDLMVEGPEKYLESWLKLSPSRIIFHFASIKDFEKIKQFCLQVKGFIEIGFAVQADDKLEEVFDFVNDSTIDFIQVMGIAKIGYQGEKFDSRSLEIIKTIRERYPELSISVDGGVGFENASDIISAGATRLVSGSTIFNGETKENIKRLQSLL